MKISLIVAHSKNQVIGKNNQLPWHLPADLQYFKKITLGKSIVMGRKTFDSIGKALPGRRNIVISRDKNKHVDDVEFFYSIDAALTAVKNEKEIMIIGGETVYQQFLPHADCIYATVVDVVLAGDAFFPALNENEWTLVSEESHTPDEKNRCGYTFCVYKRKRFSKARIADKDVQ